MKRFFALMMTMICLCSFAHAEEVIAAETVQVPQTAAQTAVSQTVITTIGTAVPASPIDAAVISFAMDSKGETVAKANDLIIANITKLKEVLVAQGVEEKNIWYKSYDVSPDIGYHNTRITDKQVIEGYMVEITLNVRLEDISLVGTVIDAVMNSGSESTPELILEQSQAEIAYESAVALAAKNAMDKASHLSLSLGLKLDQLLSITELSAFGDEEARVKVRYTVK